LVLTMKIREIRARSILTRTRIPGIDYCINPYTGCAHACRYCYATFMKKFTDHREAWGSFVDVKVNTVDLLKQALRRRHEGAVVVSSVTDPYQPVEARYRLTRACLRLLSRTILKTSILTKSDLVTRDIDILSTMPAVEAGLTITTDDEATRRIFEPASSSVAARLKAVRALHEAGIPTYVFIGPILPMNPEKLADAIAGSTREVLIDRMNYAWKVRALYTSHSLDHARQPAYFEEMENRLVSRFERHGVQTRVRRI
jgi:DNA repair photolyase